MSEFNNLIGMLNDKNDVILSQQTKIDELQDRIDKTVNHIEEWCGCVELSNIVDMLKGNKDEN